MESKFVLANALITRISRPRTTGSGTARWARKFVPSNKLFIAGIDSRLSAAFTVLENRLSGTVAGNGNIFALLKILNGAFL